MHELESKLALSPGKARGRLKFPREKGEVDLPKSAIQSRAVLSEPDMPPYGAPRCKVANGRGGVRFGRLHWPPYGHVRWPPSWPCWLATLWPPSTRVSSSASDLLFPFIQYAKPVPLHGGHWFMPDPALEAEYQTRRRRIDPNLQDQRLDGRCLR